MLIMNGKGDSIMSTFSKPEVTRLQKYLQEKFANSKLALAERKEVKDSVEVTLAGEFIGVIYKDEDDGDVSYDFNMAILAVDLPAAA
jgi:hypothetical protein